MNGIHEVAGSIPASSTNPSNNLADVESAERRFVYFSQAHPARGRACIWAPLGGPSDVDLVARAYCAGDSLRITSSRLKLAGFCRIGNSLKLWSHCATMAVAPYCKGTCSKKYVSL